MASGARVIATARGPPGYQGAIKEGPTVGASPQGGGSNPPPSGIPPIYYRQVQTPQGPVTVAFKQTLNPNGIGTNYQASSIVGNGQSFTQPINVSQNGFNVSGTQTYTYAVNKGQLVATPTATSGQITYNGVQVGTLGPNNTINATGNTVSQKVYGSVPGASNNQYLGTIVLTPTVANGSLGLTYSAFQPEIFQVQLGGGLGELATTSYNPATGQVSVAGYVSPKQTPPLFNVSQSQQSVPSVPISAFSLVPSVSFGNKGTTAITFGPLTATFTTTTTGGTLGPTPAVPVSVFSIVPSVGFGQGGSTSINFQGLTATFTPITPPAPVSVSGQRSPFAGAVFFLIPTPTQAYSPTAPNTLSPQKTTSSVFETSSLRVALGSLGKGGTSIFQLSPTAGQETVSSNQINIIPSKSLTFAGSVAGVNPASIVQYGSSNQEYQNLSITGQRATGGNPINAFTSDIQTFLDRAVAGSQRPGSPSYTINTGLAGLTASGENATKGTVLFPIVSGLGSAGQSFAGGLLSLPFSYTLVTNPNQVVSGLQSTGKGIVTEAFTNPGAAVGEVVGLAASFVVGGKFIEGITPATSDIAGGTLTGLQQYAAGGAPEGYIPQLPTSSFVAGIQGKPTQAEAASAFNTNPTIKSVGDVVSSVIPKENPATAQFYTSTATGPGQVLAVSTPTGFSILKGNLAVDLLPSTTFIPGFDYIPTATSETPEFIVTPSAIAGKSFSVAINENLGLSEQGAAYSGAASKVFSLQYPEAGKLGSSAYSVSGVRLNTQGSILSSQFLTVFPKTETGLQGFIEGSATQSAEVSQSTNQGFMNQGQGSYTAYVSKSGLVSQLLGKGPTLTEVSGGTFTAEPATTNIGYAGRTNLFTVTTSAGDIAPVFNTERLTGTSLVLEKGTTTEGGLFKQTGTAISPTSTQQITTLYEGQQGPFGGGTSGGGGPTDIITGGGGGQVQVQSLSGQLAAITPTDTAGLLKDSTESATGLTRVLSTVATAPTLTASIQQGAAYQGGATGGQVQVQQPPATLMGQLVQVVPSATSTRQGQSRQPVSILSTASSGIQLNQNGKASIFGAISKPQTQSQGSIAQVTVLPNPMLPGQVGQTQDIFRISPAIAQQRKKSQNKELTRSQFDITGNLYRTPFAYRTAQQEKTKEATQFQIAKASELTKTLTLEKTQTQEREATAERTATLELTYPNLYAYKLGTAERELTKTATLEKTLSKTFEATKTGTVNTPTVGFPLITVQGFGFPGGHNQRKPKSLVEGFRAFVVVKGQKEYLPGIGTQSEELFKGAKYVRNTVKTKTFGIERAGDLINNNGTGNYTPPSDVFRNFRIVKGQRQPLNNEYIEKAGTRLEGPTAPGGRLGTAAERAGIKQARREKRFRAI